MNSTSRLNSYPADTQPHGTTSTQTVRPEKEMQETVSVQQLYQQTMESIWEKVSQLPIGQDKVVMSQLWAFGKAPSHPTPADYPALAAHGFIVEQLMEGHCIWYPFTPYLKDFWRIGISVSNAHGYTLQARHVFEAKLQAYICTMFS